MRYGEKRPLSSNTLPYAGITRIRFKGTRAAIRPDLSRTCVSTLRFDLFYGYFRVYTKWRSFITWVK